MTERKEKFGSRLKKKIMHGICVVDEILDKASRPLMYFLELMGVIIAIILMMYLISGVRLIRAGNIQEGKELVSSLSVALGSMKELLVGTFVALPAAIGTLKAFTKKWKGGSNATNQNTEQQP